MIFTPEHVRGIVEGRKTQTRRVVKSGEELRQWDVDTPMVYYVDDGWCGHEGPGPACYPGRVKWVVGRTYAVQPGRGRPAVRMVPDRYEHLVPVFPDEYIDIATGKTVWELAQSDVFHFDGKPHPQEWLENSVGQPLRIRITEIRREKLMNISEDDASDEGVICPGCGGTGWMLGPASNPWSGPSEHPCDCNLVKEYAKVWDRINKRKGTRWQDNPLVWALTFELVKETP